MQCCMMRWKSICLATSRIMAHAIIGHMHGCYATAPRAGEVVTTRLVSSCSFCWCAVFQDGAPGSWFTIAVFPLLLFRGVLIEESEGKCQNRILRVFSSLYAKFERIRLRRFLALANLRRGVVLDRWLCSLRFRLCKVMFAV